MLQMHALFIVRLIDEFCELLFEVDDSYHIFLSVLKTRRMINDAISHVTNNQIN